MTRNNLRNVQSARQGLSDFLARHDFRIAATRQEKENLRDLVSSLAGREGGIKSAMAKEFRELFSQLPVRNVDGKYHIVCGKGHRSSVASIASSLIHGLDLYQSGALNAEPAIHTIHDRAVVVDIAQFPRDWQKRLREKKDPTTGHSYYAQIVGAMGYVVIVNQIMNQEKTPILEKSQSNQSAEVIKHRP